MITTSKLLAKIRNGGVARVCSTGSPVIYFPALAARFGYDAVWMDAEHRAWEAGDIREMILRHHHAGIDCIFRPSLSGKAALSRYLEDGAAGLMIPHVNTPEQARELVMHTKFPPLGDRGLDGSGLDAGYWIHKPYDYPARANRETALIVQIETPIALANVDSIVAVPGVDLLFLGPGDLSLRLGCKASVQDPVLRDAVATLAEACRKHQKPWGMPVGSSEDARTIIEMGAQLVAMGSEFFGVYRELEACSAKLDELLGERSVP
ncbi:MAG: HpcH/HpaI aldolase/citrate lyase family protein [Verrucomicrobium sp.]